MAKPSPVSWYSAREYADIECVQRWSSSDGRVEKKHSNLEVWTARAELHSGVGGPTWSLWRFNKYNAYAKGSQQCKKRTKHYSAKPSAFAV